MRDLALFIAAWIVTTLIIIGIVYLLGSFAWLTWDITAWTSSQGRGALGIGATAFGFIAALLAHEARVF